MSRVVHVIADVLFETRRSRDQSRELDRQVRVGCTIDASASSFRVATDINRSRRSASRRGTKSLINKKMMVAAVLAASAMTQQGVGQAATWNVHRHAGRYGTARHPVGGWQVTSSRATVAGVQEGRASFYSGGGRTANGGFVGAATCAHRSLPFGTRLLVTNLSTARQAVLTGNARGPFIRGRMLDVSRGAAGMLGMLHAGVSTIRMQVIGGAG